jgi:POT family proton-dependent oligopeptide transporter
VATPINGKNSGGATFFGHPRGLSTLFFTEMWERFSYYGMRALLILFMTASANEANPGLGLGEGMSGAIYGLYTSMVYLLTLPGGWIADNLWGQRRAVFVGGVIIAMGHFTLAAPLVGAPALPSFFLGLFFIVIGTGLLKPNVSTMVGDLYPKLSVTASVHERKVWGASRDAAFSVFYMGINVGAMLGPFICSSLGEMVNWHWGFSAAGFGMVLGLIQYRKGDKYLGEAGLFKTDESNAVLDQRRRRLYIAATAAAIAGAIAVFAVMTDMLGLIVFVTWLGYSILLVSMMFFAWLIFNAIWAVALAVLFAGLSVYLTPRLGEAGGQWAIAATLGVFIIMCILLVITRGATVSTDRKRLMVIFWLFILAAIFWSGFEQAGSSMNLFAQNMTDRVIFGWEMPTGWLQNVNPFFIVVMAPVYGVMWTWLANRDANPSIPMKFGLGLIGLGGGMFVLAWGAANASADSQVSMAWLVVTYFLFTCGELALSPVGLSSMTKLAPAGRLGQMMGVWFIAAALGNLIAGLVAARLEELPYATLFSTVAMILGVTGIIALVVSPGVRKLMGGVE